MKYISKVEAFQVTRELLDSEDFPDWIGQYRLGGYKNSVLILDGQYASIGEWVVNYGDILGIMTDETFRNIYELHSQS